MAVTAATATSTASPNNSTAEFPSVCSTCALRPSPSWMAASALPPWPATMEKPMRMVMTGSASVVTATPVPSGKRLAEEGGVHHVVKRVEHHADNGWDGELQQQPADPLRSQPVRPFRRPGAAHRFNLVRHALPLSCFRDA